MRKNQGEDRTEKVLLDGVGFRSAREAREMVDVIFPSNLRDLVNYLSTGCPIDALKQRFLADQRGLRLGCE